MTELPGGFNPVLLYVEDDARSRKVMQLMLMNMGLSNVTIFPDSADFVARVRALDLKPEVIFLDIHVTPLNGFQMLALLRAMDDFRTTPILALTASVMNEEVQQLRVAGFNGCVAKPIDLDTFPDVLQRVVNGEDIWRIA